LTLLKPDSSTVSDRRLGSSWKEWDGDVSKHEADLREDPVLYFVLLALGLVLVTVILLTDAWLLIHFFFQSSPVVVAEILVIVGVPLTFWWLAYFTSLYAIRFQKPTRMLPTLPRWLPMQVPFLAFLGRFFGLSRDRIGSSCVAITNTLTRLQVAAGPPVHPILLLPRCLDRETIAAARRIAARFGCPCFVMSTNKQARDMVRKHAADCVLAAACERDLVGGLFHFGHKVPIFALANRRPQGPCRGTLLDLRELEQILSSIPILPPVRIGGAPRPSEPDTREGDSEQDEPREA
jgi:hypothetical protein